jgi:hypothetical protein
LAFESGKKGGEDDYEGGRQSQRPARSRITLKRRNEEMKKTAIISLVLAVVAFGALPAMAFTPKVKPNLIAIDKKDKSITFAGVVMADKWQEYVFKKLPVEDPNYDPDHWHLIISADQVNPAIDRVPIIAGWATDVAVSEALASLGAKTEKYPVKTYTDRLDKSSPYPDMAPKGTKLAVYVSWQDGDKMKTVGVDDFLENSTGTKFQAVYLGKQHPSHCIVCLYGCVGGIASNCNLTVRDYFDRGAVWKIKKGVLPADGTPVLVTIQLLK